MKVLSFEGQGPVYKTATGDSTLPTKNMSIDKATKMETTSLSEIDIVNHKDSGFKLQTVAEVLSKLGVSVLNLNNTLYIKSTK